MKYKAVIETDDYKDFEFFEDGNGKYLHGIDAGTVNNEWIPLYFTECKEEPVLDKIKGYIDHIRNTGMGKKKSLEFIEKFIEGLKVESEDEDANIS